VSHLVHLTAVSCLQVTPFHSGPAEVEYLAVPSLQEAKRLLQKNDEGIIDWKNLGRLVTVLGIVAFSAAGAAGIEELESWLPWVLGPLGMLLFFLGVLLMGRSRKKRSDGSDRATEDRP